MIVLSELLEGLSYECVRGTLNREISDIVYDSREVKAGCLFVCISGAKADGHQYAGAAVKAGAAAILAQREVELPEEADATVIRVDNTCYAMAFVSAAYFGHPAKELKIIGVTGTKGKTTTTYLVRSILEQAGRKVGLIGTIEIIIGETHIHAENTTPQSYLVQKYFRMMADAGCDTVVMEVSSQGLMLHRTQGFVFDFGIFTNLEPDHIGENEHKDFDNYLHCKSLLFRQCKVGIVNQDDAHWREVTKDCTCQLETYGIDTEADLRAADITFLNEGGSLGMAFTVKGLAEFPVKIASPGRFNVYNALTAIAICRHFGVGDEDVRRALAAAKVKGRTEMVRVSDEFTLMIDYAHNAMALKSLLETLRAYNPHRLVCLFGCGGNRAKSRRYEMGEVSSRLADLTVVTSDNPRYEEPMDIIHDILEGVRRADGAYVTISDRKEAIAYCIDHAKPGDVIVLAGKGHEDYQEIRGEKHHMDERELIDEILKERGR